MFSDRYHLVDLIGLNERVIAILSKYNNKMVLVEYDNFRRPLNKTPDGKLGIYCISPDGFWNGWLVLDDDIRFKSENQKLIDIIDGNADSNTN